MSRDILENPHRMLSFDLIVPWFRGISVHPFLNLSFPLFPISVNTLFRLLNLRWLSWLPPHHPRWIVHSVILVHIFGLWSFPLIGHHWVSRWFRMSANYHCFWVVCVYPMLTCPFHLITAVVKPSFWRIPRSLPHGSRTHTGYSHIAAITSHFVHWL